MAERQIVVRSFTYGLRRMGTVSMSFSDGKETVIMTRKERHGHLVPFTTRKLDDALAMARRHRDVHSDETGEELPITIVDMDQLRRATKARESKRG